eukprot:3179364-Amphidinium_carterae.1
MATVRNTQERNVRKPEGHIHGKQSPIRLPKLNYAVRQYKSPFAYVPAEERCFASGIISSVVCHVEFRGVFPVRIGRRRTRSFEQQPLISSQSPCPRPAWQHCRSAGAWSRVRGGSCLGFRHIALRANVHAQSRLGSAVDQNLFTKFCCHHYFSSLNAHHPPKRRAANKTSRQGASHRARKTWIAPEWMERLAQWAVKSDLAVNHGAINLLRPSWGKAQP